jgi:hypothetical protein
MHEHPSFVPPADLDVPIWRYLDLDRLVALISTSCLFFPRADLLGDPLEGTLSSPAVAARRMQADLIRAMSPGFDAEDMLATQAELTRTMREWTFVSCWHVGEYESAAMWSLYGRSVAVRSTYRKLRACLTSPFIHMGLVRYVDYAVDVIPTDNTYWPFVHKRKSFEHERELRIVIQDIACRSYSRSWNLSQNECGRNIAVDLSQLVEAIYVAPGTPSWKRDAVESVARRFGVSAPVVQSALDQPALF